MAVTGQGDIFTAGPQIERCLSLISECDSIWSPPHCWSIITPIAPFTFPMNKLHVLYCPQSCPVQNWRPLFRPPVLYSTGMVPFKLPVLYCHEPPLNFLSYTPMYFLSYSSLVPFEFPVLYFHVPLWTSCTFFSWSTLFFLSYTSMVPFKLPVLYFTVWKVISSD